jgi:hypothetical protein
MAVYLSEGNIVFDVHFLWLFFYGKNTTYIFISIYRTIAQLTFQLTGFCAFTLTIAQRAEHRNYGKQGYTNYNYNQLTS